MSVSSCEIASNHHLREANFPHVGPNFGVSGVTYRSWSICMSKKVEPVREELFADVMKLCLRALVLLISCQISL